MSDLTLVQGVRFVADALEPHGYRIFTRTLRDAALRIEALEDALGADNGQTGDKTMIHYEQDQSIKLLNAMSAALASLTAQGQHGSASCIEKAMDELDTPSAAEIVRMMERNK